MRSDADFKSKCCEGEVCRICGTAAARKVEETIFDDDPMKIRHPYTAYVCLEHFNAIMGIKPKT
ncbi:MAG: hypothetical protein EOO77_21325 [Oxalobacteraceae bacterium]|nr:MAG: hypothetical protein EOO77_21325 [Oxalobacteraceae bacterium]